MTRTIPIHDKHTKTRLVYLCLHNFRHRIRFRYSQNTNLSILRLICNSCPIVRLKLPQHNQTTRYEEIYCIFWMQFDTIYEKLLAYSESKQLHVLYIIQFEHINDIVLNKIDQQPGDDRPKPWRMSIFQITGTSSKIIFEYIYLHYSRRRIRFWYS